MLLVMGANAQRDQQTGLRGMAIFPLMYRISFHAGSVINLPLQIQNFNPDPLGITIKINPVTYAPGNYSAQMGDKTKFDCSDWFSPTVYSASIPSTSTSKGILLKGRVPARTEPGVYYCLGIISQGVDSKTSIGTEYQIPIIILIGKQPKPILTFGTPKLVTTAKGAEVELPFDNTSDAFTVIGAVVQIRNVTTRAQVVEPLVESDRNMYPQSSRVLRLPVGKPLPDGRYEVSAIFQADDRSYRPIKATFVVRDNTTYPETAATIITLPPVTSDPGNISERLAPGSRRNIALKFTNQTDKEISIGVTVHKLSQLQNGTIQVLDDGPAPPLNVSVSPESFTLQPGRTRAVRVSAMLEPGTTGDYWFAVSANSAAGNTMSEEVFGHVYTEDKTLHPDLTVVQKETGFMSGNPYYIDYEVTNTGNIALKPYVQAAILENGLKRVGDAFDVPKLGDGGILPGATLHNRVMLPLAKLPPGPYALEVSYQYGEGLYVKKLLPFTVPAPKKATAPAKKGRGGGSP